MLGGDIVVFQSEMFTEQWAVEGCDVTCGVNARVIDSKLFIDDDSVLNWKPGFLCQFDIWCDADSYCHEISWNRLPSLGLDSRNSTVGFDEATSRLVREDVNALLNEVLRDPLCCLRVEW